MDNPEPSHAERLIAQPEFEPFPISRFVHFGDFRYYYAYGNTQAEDFLESAQAGVKEPVILSLGCGDIRSCFYTLWKYFSPEHNDNRFNGVHFVLNDYSAAVLARNILFLYLCTQMPTGKESQKEWVAALWAIWYSHELHSQHAKVLNKALSALLVLSESHHVWSTSLTNPLQNLVTFTSPRTLCELHHMWKMWYENNVKVSSISDMHTARVKQLQSKGLDTSSPLLITVALRSFLGLNMSFYYSDEKLHSMEHDIQSYVTTGCCFAETVLNMKPSTQQTHLNITLYERADGKYNLHYSLVPYRCFFQTFEFSPATASKTQILESTQSQFLVKDAAFESHPLLANSVQQFSLWLISSATILQQSCSADCPKISFTFDCSDAVVFCQKLQKHPGHTVHAGMGQEPKFDLIYSSNLFDHVAPPNLVLAATPLLKDDGLLFATSLNYKKFASTGEDYLQQCFGFDCKLLPLVCGVRCVGIEGEYADPIAVHPQPVGLHNWVQNTHWPKLFIWQRIQMTPIIIDNLAKSAKLLAALEGSVIMMLTTLFRDSNVLHITNVICTETAIALLLCFVSNTSSGIDITSFAFWQPLCSQLSKHRHLRPFLFQLQIQALLHGVHLHLTMTESECPLCTCIPLDSYLHQLSVKLSLPQRSRTPKYTICLHKGSHIDFEYIRSQSLGMVMLGGVKDAFIELVSHLGEDVHLIDCITGREVDGSLQLDFFLPQYLMAHNYSFILVAFQQRVITEKTFSLSVEIMRGKLVDLKTSQLSYAFRHISSISQKPAHASGFGQVIKHCGDGNQFESVIAFSSAVQSSLERLKLTTRQVSEADLQISCNGHSITLHYPYLIAYDQITLKLSRRKGTVTVLAPRKLHSFHTEKPLFIASPDIQASLPPLQLSEELYSRFGAMQFTAQDRMIKAQVNKEEDLPPLLRLKECFNLFFQSINEHFITFSLSGDLVGCYVLHSFVFDLHRQTPAIDLSFCFPRKDSLTFPPHVFFQLRKLMPRIARIVPVDQVELWQLKIAFAYFARRTTPSPTLPLGRTEMLIKHNVAQYFTRAVIYPLYTDPDTLVRDMSSFPQPFDSLPSPAVDPVPAQRESSQLRSEGKASNSADEIQTCSSCHKQSTNLKACKGCQRARYCNKDCQTKHWREHKQTCLQYKGTVSSSATSKPQDLSNRCSGCSKTSSSLKKCRCHLVLYCSVECQRNDWPRHRDECKAKPSK